jgi:hypothetical protein
MLEESLAELLYSAGGQGADEDKGDQSGEGSRSAPWWRGEECLHPNCPSSHCPRTEPASSRTDRQPTPGRLAGTR